MMEKSMFLDTRILKAELIVKKISSGYYIPLYKHLRNRLYIKDGVVLGAKLWNVKMKNVTCPKCSKKIDVYNDEDFHQCIECNKEFCDIDIYEKIKGGNK